MPIAEELFNDVETALKEGQIEVVRRYVPTLRAETENPRALSILGQVRFQEGNRDESLHFFTESIRRDPQRLSSYKFRAELYRMAGQHAAAARDYGVALRVDPNQDDILRAYAEAALEASIFAEAVETLKEITSKRPPSAFGLNLVGAMLQLDERCPEAVPYHRTAVEMDPQSADYANNLGTSLRRLGAFGEAEEYLVRAVRLDPNHYMAWYNLGNIYRATRRLILSENAYRRSIALRGDFPESHFTLACVLLQTDRWKEGWREFEWRWKSPRIVAPIDIDLPLWDGQNAAGKRILVVTEQGSGDTLQFVRYTEQLVKLGATVCIWAPKETASLLRRLPHITASATFRKEMPPSDTYIPMMSLPRILQSKPDDIPAAPYLIFDRKRAQAFAEKLGPRRERLRLGIAWAGNPKQGDDYLRSAELLDFKELFPQTPDVRWIGMQVGPRAAEIAPSGLPIEDWSPELDSFDTTAALFANLDGVVCVCTGPVHLAAALGLQTACLLSWTGDWRWGEDETRTPWYPNMTLLRQPNQGNWTAVANRAAALVKTWQSGTLLDAQLKGQLLHA